MVNRRFFDQINSKICVSLHASVVGEMDPVKICWGDKCIGGKYRGVSVTSYEPSYRFSSLTHSMISNMPTQTSGPWVGYPKKNSNGSTGAHAWLLPRSLLSVAIGSKSYMNCPQPNLRASKLFS